MSVRRSLLAFYVVVGLAAATSLSLVGADQAVPQDLYAGLRWRLVGPFRGGRINAVSGVPGQPNTFFFGSVGGGVWKIHQRGPHVAPGVR